MRETIQDTKQNLTEKFYSLLEDLYRRANDRPSKTAKSSTHKVSRTVENSPRSLDLRKSLSTRA